MGFQGPFLEGLIFRSLFSQLMSGGIFVICFIATDEVKHQTPESSCLAVGQKWNIFEKL